MSEIDQTQLLESLKQFQTQIDSVRTLKLDSEIENFEKQSQSWFEDQLSVKFAQIDTVYALKKQELTKKYDESLLKCSRNKDQIMKQLNGFADVLEELKVRKMGVEQDFNEYFAKLLHHKDKCISEWKKNSNQNLKKLNSHLRQDQREKSKDKQRQSSSKKTQSPWKSKEWENHSNY